MRIGAFFNSVSTELSRGTTDGAPGVAIDLERELGTPDNETAREFSAVRRIGDHHRLELGYFELARFSSTSLSEDLGFGDETFAAGAELSTSVDYSSLRLSYTFFLMRDSQKELGVMGGVHQTRFAADLRSAGTQQIAQSRSSTPLPVIGLNAAVFFGDKTTLRARVHIFRTDFNQHEGSLNYAALDLERQLGDSFSLGIGYSFYGTKLTSRDEALNGQLNIRHHGPVLFATFGF